MKNIPRNLLFAWALVLWWLHYYASDSVVANTSSEISWLVSNSPDSGKIDLLLTEVQKKFPNPHKNDELIITIIDTEDFIQTLDNPIRGKWMALIERQYAEILNSDIQELQKNLKNLTIAEKEKLNELLFAVSQRHLAELLLFLSENPIKENQQYEKPKLVI